MTDAELRELRDLLFIVIGKINAEMVARSYKEQAFQRLITAPTIAEIGKRVGARQD